MEWLWFNAIESFELPGRQCSLFVNDINYVNVLPIWCVWNMWWSGWTTCMWQVYMIEKSMLNLAW